MKNEDDNQTKNIPKGAIVRVSLAKTSWQDRLQLQFPVLQVSKKASNMSKKKTGKNNPEFWTDWVSNRPRDGGMGFVLVMVGDHPCNDRDGDGGRMTILGTVCEHPACGGWLSCRRLMTVLGNIGDHLGKGWSMGQNLGLKDTKKHRTRLGPQCQAPVC